MPAFAAGLVGAHRDDRDKPVRLVVELPNQPTPAGEFAPQILGVIAEFEGQRIRQKIQAGVRHARKNGKTLGRPKALRNQASNAVVKLHRQGTTIAYLSRTFGVSPPTIRKYLGSQSTDADFSTSIGGEN